MIDEMLTIIVLKACSIFQDERFRSDNQVMKGIKHCCLLALRVLTIYTTNATVILGHAIGGTIRRTGGCSTGEGIPMLWQVTKWI